MIVLSMIAVVFFVSCGGTTDTPEGIAKEYVKALYQGDLKTLQKLHCLN